MMPDARKSLVRPLRMAWRGILEFKEPLPHDRLSRDQPQQLGAHTVHPFPFPPVDLADMAAERLGERFVRCTKAEAEGAD